MSVIIQIAFFGGLCCSGIGAISQIRGHSAFSLTPFIGCSRAKEWFFHSLVLCFPLVGIFPNCLKISESNITFEEGARDSPKLDKFDLFCYFWVDGNRFGKV